MVVAKRKARMENWEAVSSISVSNGLYTKHVYQACIPSKFVRLMRPIVPYSCAREKSSILHKSMAA